MTKAISRRNFLGASAGLTAAAAAKGLIRPSFLYAQGAPSPIKNWIYIFLFGGACPRYMFPYISTPGQPDTQGPADQHLRRRRTNTSQNPATILSLPGMSQGSRVNPVGFSANWGGFLNKVQSTGARVQLITETGNTDPARISLSHVTAQQHILNCTTQGGYSIQRGLVGQLIDTYSLPAMSVWGINFPDPNFMNSNANSALQLSSLASFSIHPRHTGAFWCGTRCGNGDWAHQHSSAVEDATLTNSILRRLMQEPRPDIAHDAKMRATSEGIFETMPFIQAMNSVGVDLSQFGSSNPIRDSLVDITKSISYLNSSSAPANVRESVKIFATQQASYDSHADINYYHPTNILMLGNALSGVVHHLQAWGMLDSSLITIFTEFGRTIDENPGRGFEHGKASYTMMVGGPALFPSRVLGPDASESEANNAPYFTPQVPITEVMRQVLAKMNFPDNPNIIPEHMPGQAPQIFT